MAIRVGQVGAGAVAEAHIRAYVRSPYVSEVYLADPNAEARERLAAQFGIIKKTCEDYRELLDDQTVQLVDICTPHYLHAPQAIEAMQAGKDVIVEKPMALTVEQCDQMMEVAAATGRRLFCALCQRRFPAHEKAEELLRAGEIGKPFMGLVTILGDEFARMNDPESWKGSWEQAGGGALFDTGYHAVYMLQRFFGPARAVTAMTKRLVVEPPNKADDTSVVALEMPNNVLCSIVVTYSATGNRWSEERQLVGTEGSILIRDDPEDEMPLIVFHGADFRPVRVAAPPRINQFGVRKTLDHFVECIIEEKESDITLAEARAAVATVNAAYQSEREGRRVEVAHTDQVGVLTSSPVP